MKEQDEFLSQLMKDSQIKMPFSDFENKVMTTIEKQEQVAHSVLLDRKKGIYFFMIGMVCGLGINYIMTRYLQDLSLNPINRENALLASQIIYALLILFFLERFIKLFQINKSIKNI